jgi:hypothetical protein
MTFVSATGGAARSLPSSCARRVAALARAASSLAAFLAMLAGAAVPLAAQIGEVPAGFTRIFNGVDLSGWHPSLTSHQGTNADFSVEDGVLVMRQHPYGQGGVLLTDRSYRNRAAGPLEHDAYPDRGCLRHERFLEAGRSAPLPQYRHPGAWVGGTRNTGGARNEERGTRGGPEGSAACGRAPERRGRGSR